MARILVVDDEPAIALMIERMLELNGWEVSTAPPGEQAQDLLAKSAFDALIIDKNLAGLDGVELIRAVRSKDRTVGIVMVTGSSDDASSGLR